MCSTRTIGTTNGTPVLMMIVFGLRFKVSA